MEDRSGQQRVAKEALNLMLCILYRLRREAQRSLCLFWQRQATTGWLKRGLFEENVNEEDRGKL